MSRFRQIICSALATIGLWSGTGIALASPGLPSASTVVSTDIDGRPALVLGFEVLGGFSYELPTLPATPADAASTSNAAAAVPKKNQIPTDIKALDGRRVTVTGYMIPIGLEDGRTRQFVLVRNLMSCCYGVPPNLNEFVLVTMTNEGVRPVMDVPVSLVGKLKVGETYEDNFLVGIYQLDGEKLLPSKT